MQRKDTPTRRKGSSQKANSPDYTPTPADYQLARQLIALHNNRRTPALITSTLFQVFWDVAHHYGLTLPNHFTQPRKWLPLWAAVVARARVSGHMLTTAHYTYEPTPEREAELDAAEKEEADARAVFDLLHDDRLPERTNVAINDAVMELLDPVHPTNSFEVFRVAWPLALQLAGEKEAQQ